MNPEQDNEATVVVPPQANGTGDTELCSTITEKELYDAIRKLKSKKAPGPDNITNEMLTFNVILKSGYYPGEWKQNYIVPIFKSGDQSDPNNYRGITLSNTLGKLLSILMNQRLKKYLDEHSPLSDLQAGFRENFRTTDNLFILNTIIQHYKQTKTPLYTAFIDFKKAFDTIWRTGLIKKLQSRNIDHSFIKLIAHMYSGNKAAVKVTRDHRTDFFNTTQGVKQGDGSNVV